MKNKTTRCAIKKQRQLRQEQQHQHQHKQHHRRPQRHPHWLHPFSPQNQFIFSSVSRLLFSWSFSIFIYFHHHYYSVCNTQFNSFLFYALSFFMLSRHSLSLVRVALLFMFRYCCCCCWFAHGHNIVNILLLFCPVVLNNALKC